MQNKRLIAGGAVAGALAVVGPASAAITFDTFDTGAIALELTDPQQPPIREYQDDLDPSKVFDGRRFLALHRFNEMTTSSLTIDSDGNGQLTVESLPLWPAFGFIDSMEIVYSQQGTEFDLTQSGANDRLRIEVSELPAFIPEPGAAMVIIGAIIKTVDMNGNDFEVIASHSLLIDQSGPTPGTYDLLLDNFIPFINQGSLPADYSRVMNVRLVMQQFYRSDGTDPVPLRTSIDSFIAVPEPASLGLMAGAGGLLLRRRH